jgi:hypothetical protein
VGQKSEGKLIMPITEQDAIDALELSNQYPDREDIAQTSAKLLKAYKSQQQGLSQPLFPEMRRREVEDYSKVRGYFTEKETHGLDDDARKAVFSDLPNEEDRAAMFSEELLARYYGRPAKEVRRLGTQYRDQYAIEKWGEPVKTYKEFFDKQRNAYILEDDIDTRAQDAAMRRLPKVMSWFDPKSTDSKAMENQKELQQRFEETYAATNARISPYRQFVRQTVEDLKSTMDLESDGGQAKSYREFAEELLKIPKADRKFVLAAISANAGGDNGKEWLTKIGMNFERGLEDFVENIPAGQERFATMAARSQIKNGFRINPEDVNDPEKVLAAAMSATVMDMAMSELDPISRNEIEAQPVTQIPDEVKAEAMRLADVVMDGIDLRSEIRNVAENDIDPAKGEHMFSRGIYAAARSIPYTAVAMVPGGMILNGLALQEQAYQHLGQVNPDMSRNQKMLISAIAAPMMAYTERVGAKVIMGKAPTLGRFLNQATVTGGSLFTRGAIRTAEGVVIEMVQENIQDATPFIVQQAIAAIKTDFPDVPWDKVYGDDFWEKQGELFFAVLPLALVGGGAGSIRDFASARETIHNRDAVTLLVGDFAKADEIRKAADAGDYDTAQTLLRKGMQEAKTDSVPFVQARAAAGEALQAHAESQANAIRKAEQSGYIPEVVPVEGGFVVKGKFIPADATAEERAAAGEALRAAAGEVVQAQANAQANASGPAAKGTQFVSPVYKTREEASLKRWEHVEEQGLELHADMIESIDFLSRAYQPDRAIGIDSTGKRRTLLDSVNEGQRTREDALGRDVAADQIDDQGNPQGQATDTDLDIEAEYGEAFNEAERKALDEDDRLASKIIIGESVTEFKEGVYRTNIKVNQGATWATIFEEKTEGDAATFIMKGKRDWLANKLFAYDAEFQKGRLVGGKKLSIFKEGVTMETATDEDLKEAYSRAAIYYLTGSMRKGQEAGFKPSQGFRSRYAQAIRAGMSPIFDPMARFFRAIALRAARLNKMRREGRLDQELERELARSVGFSEQFEYEQKAIEEGQKFKQEIDPDGVLNETAAEFDSAAEAAFENSTDASFSVIHNATGYSGDTGNLGDYNAFLRSRSLLDLNEFRVNPRSNILFRPDRLYRVVNSEGYQDFLDSGLVRPNQVGLRGHTYSHLYAAVGATGARYKGAFVIEMVPEAGQWEFVGAGYARNAAAKIDATGPVRVFRAIEDGSFEVVHDNIGDAAFLEENGQTAGQDETSFSVIRSNAMDSVEENGLYDLSGNPMVVNADGTVTLYHRTTPEKAAALKSSGKFKSLENTDETFFSSLSDGQAEGYGEALITVRVNPAFVRLDDAFDDEIHVAVSNKNLSLTNLAKDEREQEPSFSVITNAQDSDLRSTGINVRSDTKNLRYADLLVDGKKLYETRDTNSLKAFIGKTVSIVRTGEGKAKAIGSVKIGEPIEVDESQFRELQDKHLVPPGSTFDIKQGGTKFLYPVTESERYLSELDVSNDGNIFTSRQVIGASPEADSTTFSVITNAQDSEYLTLAADPVKNREKLQAMVDGAARGAGGSKRLYRGDSEPFEVFDKSKQGETTRARGASKAFWLTESEEDATGFARNAAWNKRGDTDGVTREFFLFGESVEKSGVDPNSTEAFEGVDRDTISYVKFKGIRDTTDVNLSLDIAVNGERVFIDPSGALDELVEEFGVVKEGKVTDLGMLAVEMENVIRSEMEMSETSREETKENYPEMFKILEAAESGQEITIWNPLNVAVYAAFNPNQIKSADPVTYDESGNIIPLSERFNPEIDSISYSVITNAQSRIAESFNPFLRNPEQRLKIVLEAQRRATEKARGFQEIIREARTVAQLDREQAAREGVEFGKLLEETFGADTEALRAVLPAVDRDSARSEAKSRAAKWRKKQDRGQKGIDRATLIAAMRTLDAMISALPSEIRGKIGGMVRLAQFKGPGAMLDELERRANRLDVELERWLKKEADKGVKKLFERAKPAKDESGKKRVGKAGADIHDLFETARMAWKNWDAEKAEAHAVGIEAEIAKGELSPEWEAHKLLEAELVRSFGGWNQADSVRKNHALETATEIWDRAYLEYREKKAKEKERRDGIRADLRADTGKAGKKSERSLAEMAGVKLPGRVRDFFLSLLNFEQLTKWAFGKESKWAQWFADEQRKAENAKLDAVQTVTEGVEDLFTELAGGNRFKGEQLQFRMMQRSIEATAADGDIVPLSELEAISALLMWQQEDGKRHLRGKRDENGAITSDWAYDEDFIDEISGKLSPEAWRVLGYLQQEYGKEYGPLNEVYRDIYGINLPQNANYSPLTVKPTQAAAGQTADPLTGSTVSTGSFTPGSLRSRAQVSAEPDFRDAVATFIAHKKQIEHWKAHARFVLDANAVLGNREVGNSIEAAHGQEAVKIIRKWLDAIAQGGVRDASAGTAIRGFFDRITGNAASMALVGRIGTLGVQATQLGAAAALMPTGAYVVRLGKLLSGNLGWGAALDSAYIKRRLDQQPIMVQAAMQGLKAGKPSQIKHQVRKIGSLLNGADALFTAGTYAIVYDYHFKEVMRGGMDSEGAAKYATETAERVVESVAQPTRLGTRSFLEVSSSNPFMRLAWAFASDSRKNVGLMGMSYTKGNLTDKYRATLFVVLLNGLLAGVIRSAWRDLRDDEDDEVFDEKYWSVKRLALSTSTDWLVGFPVIGEEVQRAIMNMSGEYTPDGGLLSSLSEAPAAAMNIIEGDSTNYLRDIEKLMTAIGLFSDNTAAATSVMHLVRDIYGLGENFLGGD